MRVFIYKNFFLFIHACLFCLIFSNVSFAQEDLGCPSGLYLPDAITSKFNKQLYDGRGTAYGTNQIGGSIASPKPWNTSDLWSRCLQNGQDILIPPNAVSNKNDVYFQISSGDFVSVDKFVVKNNVTLMVCGYLEIGTFEADTVDEDGALLNNVRIFVCPDGYLKATVLNMKNQILIANYGTMAVDTIIGQDSNSPQCIQGTGIFLDLEGNPTIMQSGENWYYDADHVFHDEWEFGDGCDQSGGVLPINLLSFNSRVNPDRIALNWTTGSEINNDYFTLERSRDLYGWDVLGFVEGAGNSSVPIDYSFTDYRPLDGLAYYRLKQTDFDGAFKYYGPIAAHYDLGMEGLEFKVMKNFSHWVIAVPNDGIYQVEVYNLQGHRLHSERVENTLSIPAPEGAVVIRVTDGFERSASQVVM